MRSLVTEPVRRATVAITLAFACGDASAGSDSDAGTTSTGASTSGPSTTGKPSTTGPVDPTSTGSTTSGGADCDADLLYDPENCGLCGRNCLGAACIEGGCEAIEVAPSGDIPFDIALSPTHVFWTRFQGASVMRVEKTGGAGVPFAEGLGTPRHLAVDGDLVVWTDPMLDQVVIRRGAMTTPVAVADLGEGLTLLAGRAYVTTMSGVLDIDPDSGASQLLTDFGDGQLTGHGQRLYFSDGLGSECGIHALDLAPGATPELLATCNQAEGICSDGQLVWWTEYGQLGSVLAVPADGGQVITVATDQIFPQGIEVDARALVWGNHKGAIVSLGHAQGASPVVLHATAGAQRIAIDDEAVYWTTGGGIYKVGREPTQ